jgi:hypothetical protein
MDQTITSARDRAMSMKNAIMKYLLERGWTQQGPREASVVWRSPDREDLLLQSMYGALETQMTRDLRTAMQATLIEESATTQWARGSRYPD